MNTVQKMITLSVIALFFLSGCGTAPKPRGFELPVALSEVYRGGTLKPMQEADSAELGIPNQYDLVQHTCVSTPIYRLDGTYYRTDVRCW